MFPASKNMVCHGNIANFKGYPAPLVALLGDVICGLWIFWKSKKIFGVEKKMLK